MQMTPAEIIEIRKPHTGLLIYLVCELMEELHKSGKIEYLNEACKALADIRDIWGISDPLDGLPPNCPASQRTETLLRYLHGSE